METFGSSKIYSIDTNQVFTIRPRPVPHNRDQHISGCFGYV